LIKVARATWKTQCAYVLSGGEVDRYLQGCGAMAQTFSAQVILWSSAAEALLPQQRRLVYFHEFAHLRQLANGGRAADSVAHLEAEAWQAAECWSRGFPFTVSGVASSPLNALAIIQGKPDGHESAPPWYHTNPLEPISASDSITVDQMKVLDGMTLDSLLDAMIASTAKEMIVVNHGSTEGLALQAYRGSGLIFADRTVLTVLAEDHRQEVTLPDGTKVAMPVLTDEQVRPLINAPDLATVTNLRKKMNQVRAKKLKHLAFRACSMGSSTDTLDAFVMFFGCESISAPVIEDMYGTFPTEVTDDLDGWVKALRTKAKFHVSVYDKVVAFATKWAHGVHYQLRCAGTSTGELDSWVKKHIISGSVDPKKVVFHGMKVEENPIMKENDPDVYFVKDSEFRARITYR
jgi:hypothetical protein